MVGPGGVAIAFPTGEAIAGPGGVAISRPKAGSQAGMGGVAIAGGHSVAVSFPGPPVGGQGVPGGPPQHGHGTLPPAPPPSSPEENEPGFVMAKVRYLFLLF